MSNFVSNDNATTLFGDVGKKKIGWADAASSVKKNLLKANISDLKANNTTGTWTGNTYAVNGVSFAVTTDNRGYVLDISISTGSGGATATANLYFGQNVTLPKESYHMNGCPSNGSDTTFFWQYRKQSGNLTYRDIGTDRTESATPNIFTLADDTTFDWVGIAVLNGTVITTPITFKPMIRLASIKNSDYAPWIPDNAELDASKQDTIKSATFSGTTSGSGNIVIDAYKQITVLCAYCDTTVDDAAVVAVPLHASATSTSLHLTKAIGNGAVASAQVSGTYFYI